MTDVKKSEIPPVFGCEICFVAIYAIFHAICFVAINPFAWNEIEAKYTHNDMNDLNNH